MSILYSSRTSVKRESTSRLSESCFTISSGVIYVRKIFQKAIVCYPLICTYQVDDVKKVASTFLSSDSHGSGKFEKCLFSFTHEQIRSFSQKAFCSIVRTDTLCKKCLYSELFWSVFSRIQAVYGEIRSISVFSPNAGK